MSRFDCTKVSEFRVNMATRNVFYFLGISNSVTVLSSCDLKNQ